MKPSAGSVELGGKRMTRLTGPDLVKLRQETVSFIFQDSNLLPHLNAIDNVAQPLIHQGVLARPARKKALALLERLGMAERAYGMPVELSGGEQQRVAIARALIRKPKILLLDEATSALDSATEAHIFERLRAALGTSRAILVIAHRRETLGYCDRVLRLHDGRLTPDGLNADQ